VAVARRSRHSPLIGLGFYMLLLLASVIILTIAFWFRRQLMMRMRTPA